MSPVALAALILAIVAAGAFVVGTAGQLPEQVASHWGFGNRPDSWMTRAGYVRAMLVFAGGFSVVVALMAGMLPRLLPSQTNIPNRDHWLAPPRREASLRFFANHACWLGCLVALTVAAIHYTVVVAHRFRPPTLPLTVFLTVIALFLVGMVAWIATLYRRFRGLD